MAIVITLTVWIACLSGAAAALGFSSDGSFLDRAPDRWTVRTNSPVVFTVTFSNAWFNPLRGFCYADQIPSNLLVNPISVSLGGIVITNYLFVSGQPGDVYPGCTPYRWVIEQPPAFIESNAIPSAGGMTIRYSVVSSTQGTFALQEYNWMACDAATTNASFGFNEPAAQQTLSFISTPPISKLSLENQSSILTLRLSSVTGCSFVIQHSADLSNWIPLVTNVAPFSVSQPDGVTSSSRFYRALWLP
jgi:uncharacterized repeat protein (TIGR01451 family)